MFIIDKRLSVSIAQEEKGCNAKEEFDGRMMWGADYPVPPGSFRRANLSDLDSPSADFFCRQRHGYFEYAVFEIRLRLVGIDPLRQRNRTVKAAIASFAAIKTFFIFLVLALAFTANGDPIIVDVD